MMSYKAADILLRKIMGQFMKHIFITVFHTGQKDRQNLSQKEWGDRHQNEGLLSSDGHWNTSVMKTRLPQRARVRAHFHEQHCPPGMAATLIIRQANFNTNVTNTSRIRTAAAQLKNVCSSNQQLINYKWGLVLVLKTRTSQIVSW